MAVEYYEARFEGKVRRWTLATWACRLGMSADALRNRLAQGMSFEKAAGLDLYNLTNAFLGRR